MGEENVIAERVALRNGRREHCLLHGELTKITPIVVLYLKMEKWEKGTCSTEEYEIVFKYLISILIYYIYRKVGENT